MAPQKYHTIAETVLATARHGFELYTNWYQRQQERKRLKRKRAAVEDTTTNSSCSSTSRATCQENCVVPGRRAVCLDSSSDENDETQSSYSRRLKRQKLENDESRAAAVVVESSSTGMTLQQYAIGTPVRKHFPMEGWFDGQVTKGRWNDVCRKWIYCVEYEERDSLTCTTNIQDIVTQEELADIVISREPYRDPTLFSFEEFLVLWERLRPEEIEKSAAIRRANSKVAIEDSGTQHNAQYGRFLPEATDTLFRVLRLKRSDIFLDVGHGIGNSCLQAAYCTGCESRGIEVVRDRFNISLDFAGGLGEMAGLVDIEERKTRIPGKIVLRHGDLADPVRHNWLVKANKVFVNNFNGVFAERMIPQAATDWHLDHYIAGLFASMEEESLMFTLSDLQLGPTQKEVNKWRLDNNLEPSLNSSFFDVVKVELGEAGQVFSWSTSCKAPAYAYVYRRVKQDPTLRSATLLCCNIQCQHSRKGTPIPAVAFNRDGKAVVGTCECKMTLRSSRRMPSITVSEFLDPKSEYRHWGL